MAVSPKMLERLDLCYIDNPLGCYLLFSLEDMQFILFHLAAGSLAAGAKPFQYLRPSSVPQLSCGRLTTGEAICAYANRADVRPRQLDL